MADRWWINDPTERYWLESTDRKDLGTDLRAPEFDDTGKVNWRYTLFKDAAPGDIVFHFHKPAKAIVATSTVAGPSQSREIVWGARGTSARTKGTRPHERPGYVIPLADYALLASPLSEAKLRSKKVDLRALIAKLSATHKGTALYFPFELAERPLRLLQGYSFKQPRDFVLGFPELHVEELDGAHSEILDRPPLAQRALAASGQGYGGLPEVRRAIELHAMAEATRHFQLLGYEVEDVSRYKPFDLIARKGKEELTIEVKGTTTLADSVFLTRNEVDHARSSPAKAVLFVVHSVLITRGESGVAATGGTHSIYSPWNVDIDKLEPLQYKYTL
jgi:hypothetical protein